MYKRLLTEDANSSSSSTLVHIRKLQKRKWFPLTTSKTKVQTNMLDRYHTIIETKSS